MEKIDILIPIYNIANTVREELLYNTIESIDRDHFRICISDSSQEADNKDKFESKSDAYFYEKGSSIFNKPKTINHGFYNIIESNIFIGLDADMILPLDIHELIQQEFKVSKYCAGNFKYNIIDDENVQNTLSFKSEEIKNGYTPYTCGGSMIISKETFSLLGGFDEDFEGYGTEDVDLFQRIYRKNIVFQFLNINCLMQKHRLTKEKEIERSNQAVKNNILYREKSKGLPQLLSAKRKPKRLKPIVLNA